MSSFTDDDVVRVAKGLTKAQRAVLRDLPRLVDGRVLISFHGPHWRSAKGLRAAGLTRTYSAALDALNDLGLAVREHLKASGQ